MRLLMHTCCAPCSVACIDELQKEDKTPDLFFYNINIHPFIEYEKRLLTLRKFAEDSELKLFESGGYNLERFLRAVAQHPDDRCRFCYNDRMQQTAKYAAANGYTHMTTTLLVSPYQDFEGILEAGFNAAKSNGIIFLERDFRPYFRIGQQKARDLGMYLQAYCGCIYSEAERYEKRRKKLVGSY